MLRVRFAPSPTGYLHIGSARTFIFNWLYARHNGGAMILRIDDTDIERNTEASLNSIFEGLNWLGLNWDEQYRQSERLALHKQLAADILAKGLAYRDFTPPNAAGAEKDDAQHAAGAWRSNPGQREMSPDESGRRAAAGEKFVIRFRVPRDTPEDIQFHDAVYGDQSKSTEDIEDFALFRTAGIEPPRFAHLPLLVAPNGAKLSKRIHGPVVSVTTYRDAGFLPHAFMNFLCLLGWSPKNDREQLTREELIELFSFEGVNRSNAVVNFTEEDPFDAKAVWLNAETIRTMPAADLTAALMPFVPVDAARMLQITPLIQERIRLLRDVQEVADFFFADELAPYDSAELIPKKGDAALAARVLEKALEVLPNAGFTHDGLDAALRAAATDLGVK